ncbi:hypothetical protein HJFPF1_06000 [Paramyrothecium foliicola]|nr:hypothetical protein HJFPF1_06000 [Paramyrothecium foliicola]
MAPATPSRANEHKKALAEIQHFDETVKKAVISAMVRGTISYLESQGLPVNKTSIFKHFELSRSQGYAALNIPPSRRNDPEWEETRGRPRQIPEADRRRMEAVLWDERYEDANLNWERLAREAGVEASCNPRTLHRAMGTLSYRRCLACPRSWTGTRHRERRREHARRMLEALPHPGDWRRVRFAGELHFGFGLDGRMRVLPRAGERVCPSCEGGAAAQQQQQQGGDAGASATGGAGVVVLTRDIKRVHAWAAVGYGFKSELVFYDEATGANSPGTLHMSTYRDRILEKTVKPWLAEAAALSAMGGGGSGGFILEEDMDSFAHGGASKVNKASEWKDRHPALRHHFNCGESPDLSPLDALWPIPGKQWVSLTTASSTAENQAAATAPDADADGEEVEDVVATTTTTTVPVTRQWDDDDESLRQAAREAWATLVPQERVDAWVDQMPQRLRQVVATDGRLVPW